VTFEHEGRDNAKRRVIVITTAPDKPGKTASPTFPATPQEKPEEYQWPSGDAGGDAGPDGDASSDPKGSGGARAAGDGDAPMATMDARSNGASPPNPLKNKAGDAVVAGDAKMCPLSGEPSDQPCAHCSLSDSFVLWVPMPDGTTVPLHKSCERLWRTRALTGRQITDFPNDRRPPMW
jgi:hypothetical protein